MAECIVTNLRVKECKKPSKLDDKMKKMLEKAHKKPSCSSKKTNEDIVCTITKDKVTFKGKPTSFFKKNIVKTTESWRLNAIAVATKSSTQTTKGSQIVTVAFQNNNEFKTFLDAIKTPPGEEIVIVKETIRQPVQSTQQQRSGQPATRVAQSNVQKSGDGQGEGNKNLMEVWDNLFQYT